MTSLALEFSTDRRSVAVAVDGRLLAEVHHQGVLRTPRFQLVQEALDQTGVTRHEIGRLVVGLGPGSYTGIRMAISMAQGWQLGTGVATVGYPSLDALAAETRGRAGPILLAVDAQRGEFATAVAEDGQVRGPTELRSLEVLRQRQAEGWTILGPEIAALLPGAEALFPRASTLAVAPAEWVPVPAERLAPIYLRDASFVKAPPPRVIPPLPASPS